MAAAGWTPEFIAADIVEQQRLATEAQAKADTEAAAREAKRKAAEQAAFDADVKRQADILRAAKNLVENEKLRI
jgi:membrane protein involved in colicin uptake